MTTKKTSEKLELTRAINKLTSSQENFLKAVELLNDFKSDSLTNLDLQLQTKRQELTDLEQDYKHKLKELQIQTDQDISEYKREAAIKILKDYDEVPVDKDELSDLQTEIDSLKEEHSVKLETLKKEEHAQYKISLNSALSNSDLKHKAEIAELTANSTCYKNEIDSLKTTINDLKQELKAQRELTKSVAESTSKGSINQSFGKN